ncbi:MAG TPA: polysaccharide biosynthesis C-terminal domain-containing protein [Bacteroidales bacterium]|nr:polysaccharide biosynthesis C-terminal domain-containing protein [Bacteroidales bacterium]
MKLNLKEYFKISAIYTIIGAFPSLLQILVQPIIEGKDKLGPIDFSHLAISEAIASFAFIFTLFSMGNAIARFYYDFQDKPRGYKYLVASIFNSILFRGVLLLIIAFTFHEKIGNFFTQPELQDFTSYGYASIIIGLNRAIVTTATALYRNEKKIKLFVFINLLLTVLRTGLQIAAVFLYEMSFLGYIYGTVIGSSFTSIVILIIAYRKTGFKHNFKLMKEVNKFAFPLFQYGLLVWGLTFADRYFLEQMPEQLGIYNAAVNFAIGIQIILQGLQGAVQPELFSFMKAGIKEYSKEIKTISNLFMVQSQVVIILSIIPIIIFFLIFYETDLKLASELIAIIFIKQIFITQYNIFSAPIYYLKKSKIFLYINIVILIINLILNFLLIPIFKIYGAIIASITSSFLQTMIMYYYQEKHAPIKWNTKKLLIFPLTITIVTIILQLFQVQFSLNPLIAAIIINIIFISGLLILYKKEINNLWYKYIKKI